jgi:cell wall-associated NlpC family hydrolase
MITTQKIATYLLIGTLALTGKIAVAEASEVPIAGINLLLDELYHNSKDADKEIAQVLLTGTTTGNDLVFAKVTNYVNIRSKANEDSEILGKLYNNSAATIVAKDGDWYQIKSGNVTGYIKAEFLLTGNDAEELAKTVGSRLATVTTTTLKVREKASLDSTVLTLVPIDDELQVLKEKDGWVKVSIDQNTKGYVSSDYVKLWTEYEEAVSIEEEQERLEEEEAAAREAEATRNTNSYSTSSSSNQSSSNQSSSNKSSNNSSSSTKSSSANKAVSSSNSSSLRSQIVSYALQFEGNPYVWGGTSLNNGVDCSGFTQSVLGDFGIYIPRTSRTQATGGRKVSLDNLQPGDLIFYAKNGSINHVALYIGNGKVISASSPRTGIRIANYDYRQPVKARSYIN